ncbi:MAG TPA: iron-sulfur cluster biosynthesis family protein [Cyclobacteriaceae bacterium]|nr:iron-sulfur cluster biosynthesis family protein [Cyclobacteriaceae bacterium]
MFNVQPVTISQKAIAEVRKIMQTKNIPADYGLRIGIRGGHGCGGAQLIIGFDKKKDTDLAYEVDSIPVYVDKKHTMYVIGKEVDFYEGADAKGFVFVEQPINQ